MSNALAIAAVTKTLVNLLADVDDVAGGTVVTARPLDKARDNVQGHQLNVFLYQSTVDAAWRNQELPQSGAGSSRTAPPLALQLHYLLTAIASDNEDVTAHRILGKAMSILHDSPLLERNDIEAALAEAELHRQVERVRITPAILTIEEISKLWAAFQIQYRVTAAYEASAVLIDNTSPSPSPLPVLRRGRTDPEGPNAQAAPGPLLRAALADLGGAEQRLALPLRAGDRVLLLGERLGGDGATIRFRSPRVPEPISVVASPESTPARVVVELPAALPAGFATAAVVVEQAAGETLSSNQVPMAVAPLVTLAANDAVGPDFTLTATIDPAPLPSQPATLLFGARQVPATTVNGGDVTFELTGVQAGLYTVRVRIDGVDSVPVPAPVPGQSPIASVFDAAQQVVVT
jgi:hypothetical protein